jgi:hypothetical protein
VAMQSSTQIDQSTTQMDQSSTQMDQSSTHLDQSSTQMGLLFVMFEACGPTRRNCKGKR